MKTINIQVPLSGKSVQLTLRAGAPFGRAVLVASDEVNIHILEEISIRDKENQVSGTSVQDSNPMSEKAPTFDLDIILKRLLKLRPARRTAAVNSIKAMFQFDAPITDEAANAILEELRRKDCLTIDANGRVNLTKN